MKTQLVFQFKNLVGPGANGIVEMKCLDGKLVSFKGSLIVKQGLEAGCAKSLKTSVPAGNHLCPDTPSSIASVKVEGILNNKPFKGTYNQGNCQAGMGPWNAISDLWVQQGPEMVVQKVFVMPTAKVKTERRKADKEFAVRSATGEGSSCLLLLSYRPLESQGCTLVVPAPAPPYIAFYLSPQAIRNLLGASSSRVAEILSSGTKGQPPLGFPGGPTR